MVTVHPLEEIFHRLQMNSTCIILLEDFGSQQEQIDEHGVGHQLGNLKKRLILDLQSRRLS